MKKTELREKTIKELKILALRLGIQSPTTIRKEDLIIEILMARKIKKTKAIRFLKKPSAKAVSQGTHSIKQEKAKPKKTLSRKFLQTPTQKPTSSPSSPLPAPTIERKFETSFYPSSSSNSSPYDDLGELPESYGTGRLFLVARDPYWIYVYWDYTWQQMETMRRVARNGELKLRIHRETSPHALLHEEITLNPAAHDWCIHVGHANTEYRAEFGYYDSQGAFIITSHSRSVRTPPDRVNERIDARFVTIPFRFSFRELFGMVKTHFKEGEELADVLHRLQAAGFRFPFDYPGASLETQEFHDLLAQDWFRCLRMGSETVVEWFHRRLNEETSSGLSTLSSPSGTSFSVLPS